jgi:hypothetical protein
VVCKRKFQLSTSDGESSGPVALKIENKGKQYEQKRKGVAVVVLV